MFRLRTRNQHRRRHDQVQSPKLLMPRDVLRGDPTSPARESVVVAPRFVGSELALRLRIEISPVAIERKHYEQFRIHARGGNMREGQLPDCGSQSLAKLHGSISPRLRRKTCDEKGLRCTI